MRNDTFRDVCGYTLKEHALILCKRAVALPSKLIGFKPCCLALATVLLVRGAVSEWVWFSVLAAVLSGETGLKCVRLLHGSTHTGRQNHVRTDTAPHTV